MANASISQIKVGNITYDIRDADIKKAIAVTTTTDSNNNQISNLMLTADTTNLTSNNLIIDDYTISTARAAIALRNPIGTYTGTSNTATASHNEWMLTYFNVVVKEEGNPRTYDYTFSNGTITAKRDCVLEISGVMNWYDAIAGLRGFGVFSGTTVGSGTEHSSFQSFAANVAGNRKSVVFPPRLFSLTSGSSLTIGRYQQENAVYTNGANYSWITIRVVR